MPSPFDKLYPDRDHISRHGTPNARFYFLRYGLAATFTPLPGEDPARFRELIEDFIRYWRPMGALEEAVVELCAESFWRIGRVRALEDQCLASGDDARLARVLRYRNAIERTFFRAVKQLQSLRRDNQLAEHRWQMEEAALAQAELKRKRDSYFPQDLDPDTQMPPFVVSAQHPERGPVSTSAGSDPTKSRKR